MKHENLQDQLQNEEWNSLLGLVGVKMGLIGNPSPPPKFGEVTKL